MFIWIVWNRIEYLHKMDLVLNNLQRLTCHKIQTTNNAEIEIQDIGMVTRSNMVPFDDLPSIKCFLNE